MKFNKDMLLLYAVTDREGGSEEELYNKTEAALKGGVTLVQLREKNLDEEAFTEEAVKMKKLCRKYGVPLIVNDNVEVALKSGADGVHVGIEDVPVSEIRSRAGKDLIIGATAKTVEQALAAQEAGADYLGVGAVFPSPTKTGAIRITTRQLAEISGSVKMPTVAIGGISIENIDKLKGCGMAGAAVVSAIYRAEDPEKSARTLLKKVKEVTDDDQSSVI